MSASDTQAGAANAPAPTSIPPANAAAPGSIEAEAQALLTRLDKEARALGAVPQAAPLFHEMGQLWEQPLKNPRNAAICYQNAFKLDPQLVPNIRSARRLFAEVGNWQMALQLLDAQVNVTSEPAARAALRFERGQLLEERLNRPDDALAAYEQGLQDNPADLALLCQLEVAYAARKDDAKLLQVLIKLAEAVPDERLRAHYLYAASALAEDKLNQDELAGQLLDQAFARARRDPQILAAVKRRAERAGNGEALLKALASEAESQGPAAGATYYQISRIYERLGRAEDAVGALQHARKANPNDPLVLSELARLYEGFGRFEELAEVLAARAALLNDPAEKAGLLLRLAALLEERLKRDEEAVKRYQEALQLQPGSPTALTALGKLFHRKGDWAGLLSVCEREAASLEDPKLRATPLFKAAEVLEVRLAREDDAIAKYGEILQLVPGYLPAQKALGRLLEKHKRYAELAAMHEAEVAQTRDRDQLVATLHLVAQIYEDHLEDLEKSAAALRKALEAAPEHLPTIRALARLYERAGKWAELVQMNNLERSHTNDTKHIVSIFHRNAEIYEEKLAQPEEAIDCYKKVLALSPAYLPALKALGRLYGQRQRWADLIGMYRAEADIAPSIETTANLTFKIGEVYEDKLKDPNQAVTAYQEVLTLAPTHPGALRALTRIHRQSGAWDSVVEILRHEAAARTEVGEKANTLFQAAAIWEDVGKLELAVESYQEVLNLLPTHAASLRALERLYLAQGAAKPLIELYERQAQGSAEDKVIGQLKLARLYQSKAEDAAKAAAAYEAVLAVQPGNLEALKGLERLRAADRAARSAVRVKLAEQVEVKPMASALLAAAAADLDRQGAHADALALWKRAYAASPTPRATAGLEAALAKAGDARGLAALLGEQLEREATPAGRFALAMRLGRVLESQVGDGKAALAAYAAALKVDGRSIAALRAARRVLLAQGDLRQVRASLVAEAQATSDKSEAVGAWYEAGLLALDRLNEPETASGDFQKALELDPLAAAPAAKLEELLAKKGGAAALAALNLKKGEAKLAAGQAEDAARCFFEAARAYAGELGQPPAALAAAERALAAQPGHPGALQLLADLCFKAGRFADAARAYAARVEQGGERAELALIHLRLGVLYQDHLKEPERAAAHLQTALVDAPTNVEALERLAKIHVNGRNWTAAAEVLKRLTELPTEPAKQVAHTVALARVFDDGFGDPHKAVVCYRRALDLAPNETPVFDRLVALYDRLGQSNELANLLEQQAARAKSPAEVVTFRLRAAQLYAKLNEPQRAVASLRFAIEADPGSVDARAALAESLAKENPTAAIEEYRQLLRLDPFRPDAYHALYRLFDQTRQVDRQYCVASILVFLKSANDFERLFTTDAKPPQETSQVLTGADADTLLLHPAGRGPLAEVLRLVGDQLYKLYPGDLDALGLGRSDKLKPDHALAKSFKAVCAALGVERYELYQGKRGAAVTLENTDPQSVIIGADFVRKYQSRDQKFLFARAAQTLRARSLLALRLGPAELTNLLGNAVRTVQPDFARLGANDPELAKKIRKALPGKVLKELEGLRDELARAKVLDATGLVQASSLTADRAGLLFSGDLSGSLNLVVREDPQVASAKLDTFEAVRAAASRADVRELMAFAISDDFFRLRQKLKLGLGT